MHMAAECSPLGQLQGFSHVTCCLSQTAHTGSGNVPSKDATLDLVDTIPKQQQQDDIGEDLSQPMVLQLHMQEHAEHRGTR